MPIVLVLPSNFLKMESIFLLNCGSSVISAAPTAQERSWKTRWKTFSKGSNTRHSGLF